MKKTISFTVFFSVIISIMLFSGQSLSQATANEPNLIIVEKKKLFIDPEKKLQTFEGFKDIQLEATEYEFNATDPNFPCSRNSVLFFQKAGETVFHIASSNIYDPNGSKVWENLVCGPMDPNSSLICSYLMNKSGKVGVMALAQKKEPTGTLQILRESDERWHLFQYTVKAEVMKRPYYDIYFDIDFDGYLDVRFVVNTKLEKIVRTYIMYDMEWIKVDNGVDVYKKIPNANKTDSGKSIKYEYLDGQWKTKK